MTQIAEVPAREPVSGSLSKTARVGRQRQPVTLPCSAAFQYVAITQGLIPRNLLKEPRRRIAPDTTATPRAGHTGKRQMLMTLHRVERPFAHCFALYDIDPRCEGRSLGIFALDCRSCLPVPSVKDLADQARNEWVSRAYDDGNYPSLDRGCGCDLNPRPMPSRFRKRHARAAGALFVSRTRVGVYGCVRFVYGMCTVCVRNCTVFVRQCTAFVRPPTTPKGQPQMTGRRGIWETAFLSVFEKTCTIASGRKGLESPAKRLHASCYQRPWHLADRRHLLRQGVGSRRSSLVINGV